MCQEAAPTFPSATVLAAPDDVEAAAGHTRSRRTKLPLT